MINAPHLTRRQQSVYEALLARDAAGGTPPTLDELCREMGLRSRGSMHKQVRGLIEAGLVEPMAGRQRGVRLRRREGLPLVGYIAAGHPIEAIEDPRGVEVPAHLRTKRPCYVLQVRGDSMVEDGILDGDWVVVEKRSHARNGEIVVALIDEAEATLKRIAQYPKRVVLHPANSKMKPLTYAPDRVRIQGVVVGQMRSYC